MDEPSRPTIHSQADLETVWRHLMGPGGFTGASVWMLRIGGDGVLLPQLTEIAECDDLPDATTLEGLAGVLAALAEDDPAVRFAFLRSRPGPGPDDADRAWGRFLVAAGAEAGVRLEIVHLATDAGVVALPPDELGLARPA